MVELGYKLSCEEHPPDHLVRFAGQAEDAGFSFALISDHFHPWTGKHGQSPFVWTVIGAIAATTTTLRLGTGVTCPTFRYHPAIIAQAAATAALMMPGRFFLGVGSGENLNEHIIGERWPETEVRLRMLDEAVSIVRLLWTGENHSFHGDFYTVVNARLYTVPTDEISVMVASAGPKSAALAGRIGDGFVGTAPDRRTIQTFEANGGEGKPKYGEVTVCWAEEEEQARRTAFEWWPTAALPAELGQELPTPFYYEQAVKLVTEDEVARHVVCGPDPLKHLDALREFERAGYTHICVHQVGPDQAGFMRFYQEEILPVFDVATTATPGPG
ncbi:MAG: TIGR03557 family F420-dependent LLM class oxidoreductase [Thermomicrobiales bacterium]|nr:TIGR03557 family F420-dependent LLM class oxidoreductase [Thermomicrobiales bacterium]